MATEVKNPILTTDVNERHKRYLALTSADVHIAEEELPNIAKIIIENGIRYPDRLCMVSVLPKPTRNCKAVVTPTTASLQQ